MKIVKVFNNVNGDKVVHGHNYRDMDVAKGFVYEEDGQGDGGAKDGVIALHALLKRDLLRSELMV